MSKVTSKLQVTIPKALANDYAIGPGSEVFFEPAGDVIRVRVGRHGDAAADGDDSAWALAIFDAATERQRRRESARAADGGGEDAGTAGSAAAGRGWTREELYEDRVAR